MSVIIPNHNGARFLREAIDSALTQVGVSLEVIVVDDGSTDDSRAIIESYGDHIRSSFQENKGACAARNAGLALATGEYVKFLDSDDVLLPQVLAEQVAQSTALSTATGQCIVYGNAVIIDQNGAILNPLYFSKIQAGQEATAEEMIRRSPLTSMPLHRLSLLRGVGGFDEAIPGGQEYDLHLRLYFHGVQFIYQPTVCYEYRQHASATRISTKRHTVESFEQRFEGYQGHVRLAEGHFKQQIPESVKDAFANIFWDTGRFALRCRHEAIAQKYFSRSKELSPRSAAFGGCCYRLLCRLLGPICIEKFLMKIRKLSDRSDSDF